MSKKLIEKILDTKITKKTNERMTTLQLYKEKGLISMEEVKNLIMAMENNLTKSGKKNVRIMISGMAADKFRNIKYFDRAFNPQEYEEYFDIKVEDATKFTHFNQLQIFVLESL